MANFMTLNTPLLRQTVGFDRFNDMFETLMNEGAERTETYPPYNIEKHGNDKYRIVMAVAGFTMDDLNIVLHDGELKISGKLENKDKGEKGEENVQILHRGIAARAFQHTFRLADYIRVEDAEIQDGLLTIHLTREIPEEKKPRMIPINSGSTTNRLLGKKKH